MAASKSPNRGAPRRRFPLSEKRRIVELTLRGGASVGAIAREHGVNRNSLYQWRALYRAGKLGVPPRAGADVASPTFLPVSLARVARTCQCAADSDARDRSVVQLMLACGATLRIETAALDAGLLAALVAELRR